MLLPALLFVRKSGWIALGLECSGLRNERRHFKDIEAHEEEIHCVLFSPNGLYVATGSGDGTISCMEEENMDKEKESILLLKLQTHLQTLRETSL